MCWFCMEQFMTSYLLPPVCLWDHRVQPRPRGGPGEGCGALLQWHRWEPAVLRYPGRVCGVCWPDWVWNRAWQPRMGLPGEAVDTIRWYTLVLPLNSGFDRTWNDARCPTKWRESLLCQTLQVRVTNDTQKIQSSYWPKWCCTLWHNVNFRVFVGHRRSFQVVCRYVNWSAAGHAGVKCTVYDQVIHVIMMCNTGFLDLTKKIIVFRTIFLHDSKDSFPYRDTCTVCKHSIKSLFQLKKYTSTVLCMHY